MKKQRVIQFVFLGIAVLLLWQGYIGYSEMRNGITRESREFLLRKNGENWKIETETEIDNHIISGICNEKNEAGIAVFSQASDNGAWYGAQGERYKLNSIWSNESDIIHTGHMIEGKWYDIFWYYGAPTAYAELTYTIDGRKESFCYDTTEYPILYHEVIAKQWSVDLAYYDKDGKIVCKI